ncbi:MAG: type III pantothenate kinase [Coriobacteriales bacterium]|jgi:type III pantothenate kinase|nr:type III pantothenate kinase [Coriobacteriales bacterium]
MLLVTDIGNTQTVVGLYEGSRLLASWRIATRANASADELAVTLAELFALRELGRRGIDALAVASVVPPLTERYRLLGQALCGCEPLILNGQTDCGLNIRYADRGEIGADRIASAVAAVEFFGAPVIVVDFGTATNIEVVDKSGDFIGGIIAPGLQTSAEALFSAAARLAEVAVEVPPTVVGGSTRSAVQSGLTYGEIDRVDGLITRIFAELGYSAPVVATGGLASRVVALSRTITATNDNLVLEGLRIVWERTQSRDGSTVAGVTAQHRQGAAQARRGSGGNT